MAKTVGDFLWQRLREWGVRRIYGYPGDGINGIMGALDRAADQIEFVQVAPRGDGRVHGLRRTPSSPARSASAWRPRAPAPIHLLNGLYDAQGSTISRCVAIVGQQARTALGGDYQQEVDLVSLFKDVAQRVRAAWRRTPEQVRHLIDRAMRIAHRERTVTCIILPNDLQELRRGRDAAARARHRASGVGYADAARRADATPTSQRAADVLNAGERVAMLVGAGALHATDEVIEVAERLGAGIAKALLGKAAVPDDLPFVTGVDRPARHQAELGH